MNHEMLHWVHSQTKPHKIPFAFYFALRGSIIIYYFFWVRHSGCRVARLFRIDWTNEEEKMFFLLVFLVEQFSSLCSYTMAQSNPLLILFDQSRRCNLWNFPYHAFIDIFLPKIPKKKMKKTKKIKKNHSHLFGMLGLD